MLSVAVVAVLIFLSSHHQGQVLLCCYVMYCMVLVLHGIVTVTDSLAYISVTLSQDQKASCPIGSTQSGPMTAMTIHLCNHIKEQDFML